MQKILSLVLVALFFSNSSPSLSEAQNQEGFSDTDTYEWKESIEFLRDNEIVKGYEDGTYKPKATINRAEFTKIVMESFFEREDLDNFDTGCFPDVPAGAWFEKYVCIAKEEGIIGGYPDGSFKPSQTINQAEALKIILNTAYEGSLESEPDETWFQVYLDEAEYTGMFYFEADSAPGAHAVTRGEMAYFMAWLLDDDGTDQIELIEFSDEYAADDDFGFEVMTEDDCYEDEYYDEQDQTCYLLDETAYEDDDYSDYLEEGEDDFYDPHGKVSEEGPSVLYTVNGDVIEVLEGDESEIAQMIWTYFSTLIPASNRNKITQFGIYAGDDDTMAYVEPVEEGDLSSWKMIVNTKELLNGGGVVNDWKEFNLTMIHEFSHVMTLSDAQIDADKTETQCQVQFYTQEGCAMKSSFINLFVKKFWQNKSLSRERRSSGSKINYDEVGEVYYENNPDDFVTEYAATNPGEDIAETFAYFVYGKKPENMSLGKDAKITFFYEFSSLVTLRSQIRRSLKN